MIVHGTFAIEGSFKLTSYGLVIYGDIIDGKINKDNFLLFLAEGKEMKLKIKDIHFLDRISVNNSKVGFTFYYDNDEQWKRFEILQVIKQIAKILGD